MGTAVGKMEVPNRDGKTTSEVYVDKKGNMVDRPKWLNGRRTNRLATRRSFTMPGLPYKIKRKGGEE